MIFQGKVLKEQLLLRDLNPALRSEIISYNTATLIESVKLFYDTSDEFVAEIGENLKFSVYIPGDVSTYRLSHT